jgi:hypothetical protein
MSIKGVSLKKKLLDLLVVDPKAHTEASLSIWGERLCLWARVSFSDEQQPVCDGQVTNFWLPLLIVDTQILSSTSTLSLAIIRVPGAGYRKSRVQSPSRHLTDDTGDFFQALPAMWMSLIGLRKWMILIVNIIYYPQNHL